MFLMSLLREICNVSLTWIKPGQKRISESSCHKRRFFNRMVVFGNDTTASTNGLTPLHWACVYGPVEVVAFLDELGADVNATNYEEVTPLHLACRHGHLLIVKYLQVRGACLDTEDDHGETPLFWACYKGEFDIVNFLSLHGADVNEENNQGWSPLHCACKNGSIDEVALVLSLGADVNATDKVGVSPLHVVAEDGPIELIRLFHAFGADANVTDINGNTPLHVATSYDRTHEAKYLASVCAFKDAPNKDGLSPLHIACKNGNLDLAMYLAHNGACTETVDLFGNTPLHDVCWNGDLQLAEWLWDSGVSCTVENMDGETPLHRASECGHMDVVKYLILRGTDINARNNDGFTPFCVAYENGSMEVAAFLADNGADIHDNDIGQFDNHSERDLVAKTSLMVCTPIRGLEIREPLNPPPSRRCVETADNKDDIRIIDIGQFDNCTQYRNPISIRWPSDLPPIIDTRSRPIVTLTSEQLLMSGMAAEMAGMVEIQRKTYDEMISLRSEVTRLQAQVSNLSAVVFKVVTANDRLMSAMDNLLRGTHSIPTIALLLPDTSTRHWVTDHLTDKVVDKFRLTFLCSQTYEFAPCGPAGKGYPIKIVKAFLVKALPVLKAGLSLLKLALNASGNPIPALSELLGVDVKEHVKYVNVALTFLDKQIETGVKKMKDRTLKSCDDGLNAISDRENLIDNLRAITSSQEHSRQCYDSIQKLLKDYDIPSTCGLRKVICNGNVGWVLDRDDVVEAFRARCY